MKKFKLCPDERLLEVVARHILQHPHQHRLQIAEALREDPRYVAEAIADLIDAGKIGCTHYRQDNTTYYWPRLELFTETGDQT
jgi:hypothetical protein